MTWIAALDLNAALTACHNDLPGDWYRDPWGWPELDWIVSDGRDLLTQRLNGTGTRSVSRIDIPKENFLIRPAMIIDPLDRLAYQALVGHMSVSMIGNLNKSAYGWRLPIKSPTAGKYSPNDKQWDRYRGFLSFLAGEFEAAFKTDIVSCFASIPVDRLKEEIDLRMTRSSGRPPTERLFSYLDGWNRVSGRSGIPQRFQASAVLANMYLSRLDDVLNHNSEEVEYLGTKRRSFIRWMDDIWLFGDDAGELRRAQVDIHSAMSDIGLHMNTGKTELLEGDCVVSNAREIEHSAIDQALTPLVPPSKPDTGPLDELVDRLVQSKEIASRTSIKFATTRMRDYKHFVKVDDFIDVAMRMPHAADSLARLFRDAKRTNDLEEWYVQYLGEPWSRIEWAAAQLGTMFPSNRASGKKVVEAFESAISRNTATLPMTAVAAQRLAKWCPADARAVLGDAARRCEHPLQRRVLALAGLQAGCPRSSVERWLNEFEENRVTLEMLRDRSFRKVPLKPDFG